MQRTENQDIYTRITNQIVSHLDRLRVEVPGIHGPEPDTEPVPGHGDARVAGVRAGDVAAQLGGSEVLGEGPIIQGAVERHVKRVEGGGGQRPVVRAHDRVRLVVLPGPGQGEDVLAVVGRGVVVHGVEVAHESALPVVDGVVEPTLPLTRG